MNKLNLEVVVCYWSKHGTHTNHSIVLTTASTKHVKNYSLSLTSRLPFVNSTAGMSDRTWLIGQNRDSRDRQQLADTPSGEVYLQQVNKYQHHL